MKSTTETHPLADTEAQRQTQRQTQTETDRETHWQTHWPTDRQEQVLTLTQTDSQRAQPNMFTNAF
jgi:hypothetical protein